MAIILLVSLVLLTVLLPAMSDHDHKLKNFAKTRKMFNEERYTNAYAVEVFGDEEVAKAIAEKYFFQYNGKVLFSPSHNFKIIRTTLRIYLYRSEILKICIDLISKRMKLK